MRQRHGPRIGCIEQSLGGDGVDLSAIALRLANALRKQGMVFAQIAAHHQHALKLCQAGNGGTQITYAFRLHKFGIAQTMVNVVGTQ